MTASGPRMHGGLRLAGHKDRVSLQPLGEAGIPPELIVSLDAQGRGASRPCVTPGQRVLRGQCIAAATLDGALPVHAPSSGVVRAVEARPQLPPAGGHRSHGGAAQALCVVIACDGQDEAAPEPLWPRCDAPHTLTPEQIRVRLHAAGLVGLGGAGFPSHRKLVADAAVDTLIVNAVECEPWISCDQALMADPARVRDIVAGSRILARALGAERTLIGVEDDKPAALSLLREATAGEQQIRVIALPTRYPQGDARQLVRSLTGREVPGDGVALDVGVACFNVATVHAAHAAIVHAQPLLERVVSLGGPALRESRNLRVRLGTRWDWLLRSQGIEVQPGMVVLQGGPMMGVAVPRLDLPVTAATQSIYLQQAPPPRRAALPCIRCGDCAPVCPVRLQPQLLLARGKAGDTVELARLHLPDCIECGCCDLVCPSHIPLTQLFRDSKRQLAAQAAEQQAADAARQRHAARQIRLQREAAEAAQTRARRRAVLPRADAATDPVAAALARARSRKAAPPTAAPDSPGDGDSP